MTESNVNRISFLDIPIDQIHPDDSVKRIEEFFRDNQKHQIVFLDVAGVLRARRDPVFLRCLQESSLILPITNAVIRGARFLGINPLHRFEPFEFVIQSLGVAERLNKSAYLLGGRKDDVEQAEKNLRVSFPQLKLVGRFSGYFRSEMEKNIILVTKKTSPSFILVGNGIRGKSNWIFRHKDLFPPGVYVWVHNCLEIFSGRENKSSHFSVSIKKPWRMLRIFMYFYFCVLLLIQKIARR